MRKSLKTCVRKSSISCFLILLFLGLSNFSAFAQEKNITGTVLSADGMGLPGVNVVQKGTRNGVTTDFDGNFSIQLKTGSDVLVFSYIGFKTSEKSVGSNTKIIVTLTEDSQRLDEVVVIGYGTANKRDVLGSIGSVKSEQISETAPVDALEATQGRIAGVSIVSNNGPGASSEIRIRGTSTFFGGVEPLYVVDGQQMDNISNIDPSDIASIEILKDGASAAIYGSKSANGVVLITTKAGKPGVSKIEANYSTEFSSVSSKIPVSNTRQKDKWLAYRDPNKTQLDTLSIRSQHVIDVQDLMFQQSTTTQANVSFSGGTENSNFYWNTGVLDETGVLLGASYKRFTSNLKLNFTINKKLSAGTRISLSYDKKQGLYVGRGLREMSYRTPDVLIYDYDGSYIDERYAVSNPVAIALEATNDTRSYRANSFNYLEYAFSKDLKFKTTIGVNFGYSKHNSFNPATVIDITSKRINGSQDDQLSYDIQQENYFTYNKEFKGGHKFSGLLGMSTQVWEEENSQFFATEFNNEYIKTFYNVAEFDLSRTGTDVERHSLASFFSRLTYDYKGKYLVAGTLRLDGSSRFGKDNRWGSFPSASVGWRISRERFFQPLGDIVSELKLRAGYAITGNERIGNYESALLYQPGYFYNGVNGIAAYKMSNDELGWEKTSQFNYGLDLSLLNRRINITVDSYVKTTTDLLYSVPVPQEIGYSGLLFNIGSVENRGLEIGINAKPIVTDNFKWSTNFNIAFNNNKVIELADKDGFFAGNYKIEEGQPLGNMYGYKNLGVYQYDESNAYAAIDGENVQLTPNFDTDGNFVNHTLNGEVYTGNVVKNKFGNTVLKGGDIIWEDLNNDGIIDADNDRKVVGNGIAKYTGGFYNSFDYKNFSISFLFNYNFGNNIYRDYDYYRDRSVNNIHVPGPNRIDGAWLQQGDIAEYPSLEKRSQNAPDGINSFYVSKGDFINFKNVKLGYSFDEDTMNKIGFLDNLSISLTVNNVLMFTNYNGYNPEISSRGNALQPGWDGLRYPNQRDFILGLKANF